MADQTPPFRPLYFIASYPYSGGERVRAVTYAASLLSREKPPARIDFSQMDNVLPWDIHERLYEMATGKDPKTLTEAEVAAARGEVHRLLAEKFPGLPVVRTQAMRATYHGHRTINGDVARGASYIVRDPLSLAAAISQGNKIEPLKAISLMVQFARRVRPHQRAVVEPQGSWSQNVDSWTAGKDKNIHVVRYEDLIKRPSKTYESIFSHMRLPISGASLDKAIRSVASVRGELEDRGMRDLKPLEARAVIEVNARAMDRHGYLTDEALDYARIGREEALALSEKHNREPARRVETAEQEETSQPPKAAND